MCIKAEKCWKQVWRYGDALSMTMLLLELLVKRLPIADQLLVGGLSMNQLLVILTEKVYDGQLLRA